MSREPCPKYPTACGGGPERQHDLEPDLKELIANDVSPEQMEGAVKCRYCGMVYRYFGIEQAEVLGGDLIPEGWKPAVPGTTVHRNNGRPFFMRPSGRIDYAKAKDDIPMGFGKYEGEGPIPNVSDIRDVPGVYIILGPGGPSGRWRVIDIGQSVAVRSRVENHDRKSCWTSQGYTHYAAIYVPGEQDRLRIEEELRKEYKPPCGAR